MPPKPNVHTSPKAYWVSMQGAITHSLGSWLQGRSEDTLFLNPCFKGVGSTGSENHEYSIYCIHGTADRSFAFYKMIKRLLKINPETSTNSLPESVSKIHLIAFNGRSQGSSIGCYADQLKSKIIKNKDKHVVLFGHSRGGLIAAKFAQDMAAEIGVTVHGVLPFCSPFEGSPLAIALLAAISTSVDEMRPNSDFLTDLHASIARTEEQERKYFYFGVENDSIVPTDNSFIKEGAHSVILIPHHGHLSILTSQKIVGYVSDCLDIITKRPFVKTTDEERTLKTCCLELEAEIIALTYRSHLYSNKAKLTVLSDLKALLSDLSEGNRSEYFSEATTVGDFICMYLKMVEPVSGVSLHDIMRQQLNPRIGFFNPSVSKSLEFIDTLIQSYQGVLLPEKYTPGPQDESESSIACDWEFVEVASSSGPG